MKTSIVSFLLLLVSLFTYAAARPASTRAEDNDDVTVYYEHNTDPEVFSFGDCVPWTHDESPAETVVFGKEATCSLYTDEQCEAPSNEDDVHVWPGQKYWYPGSSYPLKGGSARCDVPQ